MKLTKETAKKVIHFADEVITLFFDPETLERDYDAEDKWREVK